MVPTNDSPMIVSIGGAPSSGTTLLADLFDSIPGAACGPELNVLCIPRGFGFDPAFRESALSNPWETGCCYAPRSRFLNGRHLAAIGLDEAGARELVASADGLPAFMRGLAGAFARHRGRPIGVFAEKTPANVTCAGRFLDRFPDGRFIHVVRDGRAVAASLRRRGYTLWEAAIIWLTQAHRGLAVRDHPRCMTVRYEDVAADPFRAASGIAAWLGIGADAAEIERRFRGNSYRAELPRVAQWSTAGMPSTQVHRTAPYREELSATEIGFLETSRLARFGPDEAEIGFDRLLAAFGYPADGSAAGPCDGALLLAHADFVLESRNAVEHRDSILWHAGHEPQARAIGLHSRLRSGRLPWWADARRPSVREWLSLPAGAGIDPHDGDGELRDVLQREGLPVTDRPGCPDAGSVAVGRGALATIDRQGSHAYRLRALGPPEDLGPSEDLATQVTRLLNTHLYACCRKVEAGQAFGDENALTLALAVRAARQASLLEPEFDRAAQALAVSASTPAAAAAELPWPKEALASSHLRRLHDAVALGTFPAKLPEYQSPIRGALVAMALEQDAGALRSRLEDLLRDHVDPGTGLVVEAAAAEGTPRKPYLSALVPLALVCAAGRLGIALRSPASSLPRPEPPQGDSLAEWMRHAQRLLAPPDLPTALEPQCPDGHAAACLRTVARSGAAAMVDRSGWAVAVLPAPPEAAFVVSVRHDVDRPFRPEHAARLLALHERHGRCTSVYFRPSTFDAAAATELRDAGCELGLHVSHWDDAHRTLLDSLRALAGGPVGVTYHGGMGSRYWRGLRSVRADIEAGAAYTEVLHEWFPDPRMIRLGGRAIMATPLSVKVDAQPGWVDRHLQLVRDFRGHAILELHPDLPGATWEPIIAGCLAEGAVPRRVVDHVDRCRDAGAATVEATVPGDGVLVKVRAADGLAVMVRTDPTVFMQDSPGKPMRLRGRLSPGGEWMPYAVTAGECMALLRPASTSATRTPASPRP